MPELSISILTADDHEMILNALDMLLQDHPLYKIVDTASSILSLKEKLNRWRPGLLILDLNFNKENVLDTLEEIKLISRKTKILILSSYDAPFLVKEAFQKGADGYLLKDTGKEELISALDEIYAGKKIIGESVQQVNMERKFADMQFVQHASLSGRELQVVDLLVKGNNEQRIAEILFISKHTVHDHKKNIFRKLKLRSNIELFQYAYEHGLVKTDNK